MGCQPASTSYCFSFLSPSLSSNLREPVRKHAVWHDLTMDGISAVASVLQVVQICTVTIKFIGDLKAACRALPGRLKALEEEVLDLKAVLEAVEEVTAERKQMQSLGTQNLARFDQLLDHATCKLRTLQQLLLELIKATEGPRIALIKANAWRKARGQLTALQSEIQDVKVNLNTLLGASNS